MNLFGLRLNMYSPTAHGTYMSAQAAHHIWTAMEGTTPASTTLFAQYSSSNISTGAECKHRASSAPIYQQLTDGSTSIVVEPFKT